MSFLHYLCRSRTMKCKESRVHSKYYSSLPLFRCDDSHLRNAKSTKLFEYNVSGFSCIHQLWMRNTLEIYVSIVALSCIDPLLNSIGGHVESKDPVRLKTWQLKSGELLAIIRGKSESSLHGRVVESRHSVLLSVFSPTRIQLKSIPHRNRADILPLRLGAMLEVVISSFVSTQFNTSSSSQSCRSC